MKDKDSPSIDYPLRVVKHADGTMEWRDDPIPEPVCKRCAELIAALKETKALLENTKGNMFVHRPMLDWFDRRDALLATINKALGETGVK